MFTHLHTHSYYSFLEGVPAPAQLAEAAASQGMAALALTDHNRLSGAIEFYDACHKAGIQPILGLDLDIELPLKSTIHQSARGRLVLLAMDREGWANLSRLSSHLLTQIEPAGGNALPFEALTKHTAGLICLTGDLLPEVWGIGAEHLASRLLERLKELFDERLYIQLEKNSAPDSFDKLAGLAKRLSLPLVATQGAYYISPDQAELQRLLAAMRLNSTLDKVPSEAAAPPDSHFTSPEEMALAFAKYPQAIEATQEIADRCQLELPLGRHHYPNIDLPEGLTAMEVLRGKATQGARELYGELTPEITARLEHELRGIDESGYAPLFLIMEELVQFAWEAEVPISSRGSAASSLVAHCLGITSPDPIALNLYFERFLNPARKSPPDIDTDLCSRRRDKVINHVYEKYGAERVAMVSTTIRFRRRSALREVAKAHGLSSAEIKKLVDALPYRYWGPPSRQPVEEKGPFDELEETHTSAQYRSIFQFAAAVLDFPRHLSIHPGGVVVAPGPLTDLVPTQFSSKGVVITQFDLDPIERIGMVKIDLLGTKGLTVIGDVADQARTRQPGPALRRLEFLESIPRSDPETAELVRTGRTIGCFQIESPGMRATLKEIQAQSLDDIMVALSLYRPGPMTGGLKDAFVRRFLGKEAVSYLHPALEPLLADTYGVILYQEQVLRVAADLAGLSLSEGDLLRRAMSHFDPGEQMVTLKKKFVEGAEAKSGVPPNVGERVWELMAAFAGYGYPKAHAASYAQVSWRSAWCKTHYPAEFITAVLANWGGYYRQSVYLMEARRLGLTLHPPHVNHSGRHFALEYVEGKPQLYMGLDQVRELGRQTQKKITQLRPFQSLADFMIRAGPRKQEAENLIKAGGLDGLGSIPALLRQLKTGRWQAGQLQLFEAKAEGEADWGIEERAAAQGEILGVSVEYSPLELAAGQIRAAGALTTVDAALRMGEQVRIAGMRQSWRRYGDGRGGYSYFMSLEDLEGSMGVSISGEVYRRCRGEISGAGPYLVEGQVVLGRDGEPGLRAEEVRRLPEKLEH